MKALFIRLTVGSTPTIIGDRPQWRGEADALIVKRFLQYWGQQILGVELNVVVKPEVPTYDATVTGLDTLASQYAEGQDFIIFVSDDEIFGYDANDGFTNLTTWVWAQHLSGSPDWSPLRGLIRSLTHEIEHIALRSRGYPTYIFNDLVHRNDTGINEGVNGYDDYWLLLPPTPVSESFSQEDILGAMKLSGYYDLLSGGQQSEVNSNPRLWLHSHPYLYFSYPSYFTEGLLPFTHSENPQGAQTPYASVGGDYRRRKLV